MQIIDTGYFYADGGAMFGAVPKTAWSRRYPSDEHNGCVLAMRSALVETPERLVLIDTGAGDKHLKTLSYYRFFGMKDIRQCLRERGFEPEDVTDVVLTHLHFDHCAGCTRREADGTFSVTFPRATHWVSRRQWDNFLHPHPLESGSFFAEDMQAVEDAGLLRLIDGQTGICPEVELRLADGHTPGQIVPYIYNKVKEGADIFAGDVVPLLASLSPEWISAYDTQPLLSYESKVRLLEEAARCGHRIVFCHDAYALSSGVRQTAGGLFVRQEVARRQ